MQAIETLPDAALPQPLQELEDRPAGRDLVVEHDRSSRPSTSPDDRVDHHGLVVDPLLAAGRDRQAQQPRELRRRLGVAEIGRDDDRVGQVAVREVVGEDVQGVEVIDRHAEEAVDLRRVQRHRQDPIGARGRQQIGHQPGRDRDARRVLLVRARVGVVRDDGRHPRRRGAARRVQHQQQFHQVVVDRGRQRLDDEDVVLAAVGVELHLETAVAEAADRRRADRHPEMLADLRRQLRMRAAAEHRHVTHCPSLPLSMPLTNPDYGPPRYSFVASWYEISVHLATIRGIQEAMDGFGRTRDRRQAQCATCVSDLYRCTMSVGGAFIDTANKVTKDS